MDSAGIEQVRGFNRTVAERIGALTDGFLGRKRPMGESRVLWEIGAGGAEVRELRSRLGLDSGYLSRVLRSLERARLISVRSGAGDGRVRYARLTPDGRAERAELDRRADAVAWTFLAPLSQKHREQLTAAMADVERLLRASMIEIALEDPATPDARWCIDQYIAELNTRFESGFDPSRSISADADELTPPKGGLLIARMRGRPVGCGALKFHDGAPAELKRMWVAPEVRGLGLGRRILVALEQHARERGVRALHLETNGTLTEAIALYRASGYREVPAFNSEPYAHHWFEKALPAPPDD
jgi:DNA-binding MarR family transcriptional regulator/GNAT superfamily N-acetyltransferase